VYVFECISLIGGGVFTFLDIHKMYTPICILFCLLLCVSLILSLCLPFCLSVSLSIYLFFCICLCLSVSVFVAVCMSVCEYICLSVCLSIYPTHTHTHSHTHTRAHTRTHYFSISLLLFLYLSDRGFLYLILITVIQCRVLLWAPYTPRTRTLIRNVQLNSIDRTLRHR